MSKLTYTDVAHSDSFRRLLRKKKQFLLPMSVFFLAFYFTLPLLTAFSTVLNEPAVGPVSWAWLLASAQFIMTWALCIIYTRRAARFDEMVEAIKAEVAERGQAPDKKGRKTS
ncbi:DUF485 domain-containing protein [Paenibacillus pasadenensis]|uniref:DUF485 domain-containing protein n=1 Tax=Paenibacillus pasadenensis TaxID=217090 RepID=A0A2N5N1T8_9BACL|nr:MULTISPECIES: DUF485 domain-containing protein [Paenibacillus]PLT44285.1 hypothetical protein B8V81_2716 [Paenibacillus pasadenensis]QGG54804.1 DUF485 domain-containing protein [Paenibacillus sp. B01]